jgi:hypothetical protein
MAVRMLFGLILGVIVTIAGAYAYDASTGRVPNGLQPTAADGHPPMVNWDVVSENWNAFQDSVRNTGDNLERSFKRHTG